MAQELHDTEPLSDARMREWIAIAMGARDEFGSLRALSDAHRDKHGCDLYPSADGPLLGVLASIARPRRALEVGCGLGYSALWIARGAGEDALVETIERDAQHARIATAQLRDHGYGDRVNVLVGSSSELLPTMKPFYDLVFFDGDPGDCVADLEQFRRLLRSDGLLVSSNLFLGRYAPDAPWLAQTAEYRRQLLDDPRWQTAFVANGKALSVRR